MIRARFLEIPGTLLLVRVLYSITDFGSARGRRWPRDRLRSRLQHKGAQPCHFSRLETVSIRLQNAGVLRGSPHRFLSRPSCRAWLTCGRRWQSTLSSMGLEVRICPPGLAESASRHKFNKVRTCREASRGTTATCEWLASGANDPEAQRWYAPSNVDSSWASMGSVS
jgi:hypothetical protein